MNLAVPNAEFPIRLRLDRQLNDRDLVDFCALNEPLRIERDSNGDLILMSPTLLDGGLIEGNVYFELTLWARSDGRGLTFGPSAGFTLADTSMRAADASWMLLERWQALSAAERHSFTRVCPDFVIEVRSDSDWLKTLREKMSIWINNGAQEAWLIDPERKAVEVYRPHSEVEMYENPSSVQGQGPVRGFELVMSRIWTSNG